MKFIKSLTIEIKPYNVHTDINTDITNKRKCLF